METFLCRETLHNWISFRHDRKRQKYERKIIMMKTYGMRSLALTLGAALMLGAFAGCGSTKGEGSVKVKKDSSSALEDVAEQETTQELGYSTEPSGTFTITLYPDVAPLTCENFENLVKDGFYDGLTFHRVVDDFMAQGGDPHGDGTGGSDKTIKGEFGSNGVENSLSHQRGVVSMARSSDPDSASSQFFICYTDCSFLDQQYAAFGEVTEGMDTVDSFLQVSRSMGTDGAVSSPDVPIVILKAEMVDDDADGNPRVQFTMNDFLNE